MSKQAPTRRDETPRIDWLNPKPPNRRTRLLKASTGIYTILLLFGLTVGAILGRMSVSTARPVSAEMVQGVSILAKPGPWGNLGFLPITIAAPNELLPVRVTEETPVAWYFKGQTRPGLGLLLDYLKIPATLRDQFLTEGQFSTRPEGIEVIPPREFVFALEPRARRAIYEALASCRENDSLMEYFLASDIETIFKDSGVSKETVSRLQQVSSAHGKYLVCYCLPYVLSAIPSFAEKANFLKAISRQQTMLAKLRVTPKSDINALAAYWGKACWSTDVKALLESLSRVPGGGQMDVVELLPPLPTSLLYTYPIPQNPIDGPTVKHDCHWTSFNFFRNPPDPQFNNPQYILEKLKTEYYPIQSDRRFGDLILFFAPGGDIIHSAVYLADDVAFTKNGDNATRPWIFSTIEDMLDLYSFHVMPDKNLTIRYYRHKYY